MIASLKPAHKLVALDLLGKFLCFDPNERLDACVALHHPWLSLWHDPEDEPDCPKKFEKWHDIEELETMEEVRQALWDEIQDCRSEVRSRDIDIHNESEELPSISSTSSLSTIEPQSSLVSMEGDVASRTKESTPEEPAQPTSIPSSNVKIESGIPGESTRLEEGGKDVLPDTKSSTNEILWRSLKTPMDPVVTYAQRPSALLPFWRNLKYNPPLSSLHTPGSIGDESPGDTALRGRTPLPVQGHIVPVRSRTRSRTRSMVRGDIARKLLRTISTGSIHKHSQGRASETSEIETIGKRTAEASPGVEALPSAVPNDFGILTESESLK